MATNEETLALVEGLARIARDYKLDVVEVEGVRLSKTHHAFDVPPPHKPGDEVSDDDLFHSAEG